MTTATPTKRGTSTITKRQVETAWKLSTIAADWHEKQYTERSRQRMIEAEAYAVKLQAQYDEQQHPTKKVVLAFGLERKRIDPAFCDHANAIYFFYPDGSYLVCPDCGATIDADTGEVIRVASDDIPIFEEEL